MRRRPYKNSRVLMAKVIQAHCANMVEIDRYWKMRRWTGNTIRLRGIQTAPPTTEEGKTLRDYVHGLLAGSYIEIVNAYGINEFGHLICDVLCNGRLAPYIIPEQFRQEWDPAASECNACTECRIGYPKSGGVLPFNTEVVWYPPELDVNPLTQFRDRL